MTIISKQKVLLFVDKSTSQWIVQDELGQLWLLPVSPNPWEQRQLIVPHDQMRLEPVPGHYKTMLGVPT